MLDAFARAQRLLVPQVPLYLIVVGDGREQPALERMAAQSGLGHRIRFTGFQGNPGRWMRLFDCMVQPSLTEGTPNSVLEAFCLGVPVIATAVGGVPDMISHGDNGLLVPPRDAVSLATAMAQLVVDSRLRNRLASQMQQTSSIYSPSVQKESLLAVYRTACAA